MTDFNFNDAEDDAPDWLRIDSLLDPILEDVYQQGIQGAFIQIALALTGLVEKPGLLLPDDPAQLVCLLQRILECARSLPKSTGILPAPKLRDEFECEGDAWTHVEDRLFALGCNVEGLAKGFKAVAQMLEMLSAGRSDETRRTDL
jgi:hypothetical protein